MLNLGLQKVHPGEGWFQDMLKWHETTLYDSPNYGDPEDFIYIYKHIPYIYQSQGLIYIRLAFSSNWKRILVKRCGHTHTTFYGFEGTHHVWPRFIAFLPCFKHALSAYQRSILFMFSTCSTEFVGGKPPMFHWCLTLQETKKYIYIYYKITYPTLGKEKSSSNRPWKVCVFLRCKLRCLLPNSIPPRIPNGIPTPPRPCLPICGSFRWWKPLTNHSRMYENIMRFQETILVWTNVGCKSLTLHTLHSLKLR